LVKWLGAALLVTSGIGAVLWLRPSNAKLPLISDPSAKQARLEPSAVLLAEPAATAPDLSARVVSTPSAAPTKVERPKHAGAARPGSLAHAASPQATATIGEESSLLRTADAALHAGNLLEALALLDEHRARFPSGVLAEECSAERVTTLCRLGRTGEACAEARRFDWASSDSPLARGIESSCAAREKCGAQ
jgi:hypothetical protein